MKSALSSRTAHPGINTRQNSFNSLYVIAVIITDSPNIIAKIVSPVKYIGLSFIAAAMSITSAHTVNTNDDKNDNTFMILSFKLAARARVKGKRCTSPPLTAFGTAIALTFSAAWFP